MRHLTLTCLLLWFTCSLNPISAYAQVQIDSAEYADKIGTTISYESYQSSNIADINAILDAKGSNQMYDFTQFTDYKLDGDLKVTYKNQAGDYPGASVDAFSGSNFVTEQTFSAADTDADSTWWQYRQIQSGKLLNHGLVYISASDFNGDGISPDTLYRIYRPDRIEAAFPMTLNTSWKDTLKEESRITGTDFSTSFDQYVAAEVVGSGTLKLPQDQTFQCIRIDLTTTTKRFIQESKMRKIVFINAEGNQKAMVNFDENQDPLSVSYISEIQRTDTKEARNLKPDRIKLNSNYPNPFNPSTKIRYFLRNQSHINLAVYNMKGQLVKTLVNKSQPNGWHQVVFQAESLPSGLYVYRLKTPTATATRKMILLK